MKAQGTRRLSPILIGIFLILAIAVTIFLIQQGVLTITRARPTSIPQNIQITNISDSSFTVLFTTELNVSAALKIPEGGTGNTIILDDRDKSSGIQKPYYSHHITVPNLKPQQTYSFIIISDGKEYESPVEYMVTTGEQIANSPPQQNPLFGTVILPDGSSGTDTIVTARTPGSQVISSVTNERGNYILPTNSLKNEQLNSYQNLSDTSQILLNFFRQNFTGKITTDYKLAQNLPAVTLNQNYSFFPQEEQTVQTPEQGFESIEETTFSSSEPTVVSPRENQSFIDSRPTFSGTGGPNKTANISIPSANITETVNISPQGRWLFNPEKDISQGEHKASFTIQNESGINTVISRTFSIFPSGSQVSQSATPSATPTFSPTPSPTRAITTTPTPTISTTPSPTVTISVTPSISVSPTVSPSPTLQPTSTPTVTIAPTSIPTSTPLPPIEKPGGVSQTTILAIFSIVLIVAGAAIFFAL